MRRCLISEKCRQFWTAPYSNAHKPLSTISEARSSSRRVHTGYDTLGGLHIPSTPTPEHTITYGYPEYRKREFYLQPGVNNQTRLLTAPRSRYYFHSRIHWKDGPLFN